MTDIKSMLVNKTGQFPEVDIEQFVLNAFNSTPGNDDGTGVQCAKCMNRGEILKLNSKRQRTVEKCECFYKRRHVQRLQNIGIWEQTKRCRFDNFKADTPTQKAMLEAAQTFVNDPYKHWIAFCGQSGAGKTHICTAIYNQIADERALAGQYFRWIEDSRKIKSRILDDTEDALKDYKETELLYIDDMFKTLSGEKPSAADIRLAFELLDSRSATQKITIISTEWPIQELFDLDEAIAGRIKERCGDAFLINIGRDRRKNYRINGM